MADPKYADLPGIAYDQADVYETSDLPESDQNTDFYEEESDSIERLHISASEAFNRFKGKTLTATNVDFSDQLTRKWRTGYDARSGAWELVGVGEKETPLQKYQRLQCEMKELVEEVAQLKESAKESSAQEQSVCTLLATQVEKAQQQLSKMRLEETLGSELVTDFSDSQGVQFMKLLAELESLKQGAVKPSSQKQPTGETDSQIGTVTYQLKYQPERAALARSARIADLEQRLHKLEAVVGATPQKMATLCVDPKDKGRPCSLLQAAQLLNAKVSLLDTGHLDQVEGRLIALAEKMDTAAEKGAARAQDAERDRKIAELYELVKSSSEDLSALLPQTLDRMLALESLHQQALDFSRSLSQLEALQEQISGSLQDNDVYMKSVQQSFTQNVDCIKKNMASLETRINAITKK
ncbi:dynactin subunit 2 [Anabrus simplex]|uniref:dynactin subunit 2 n=1 Tax=Anabrus simplex TaxID=316456 RepID=UPI0034DD3CBC